MTRCEGKTVADVTGIAGGYVGRCDECQQIVACSQCGIARRHERDDVLVLFS
jgi:hypothetical protein